MVRDQQAVVNWPKQRIKHDVDIDIRPQFAPLDTFDDDCLRDGAPWRKQPRADRVLQTFVALGSPDQLTQNLSLTPSKLSLIHI